MSVISGGEYQKQGCKQSCRTSAQHTAESVGGHHPQQSDGGGTQVAGVVGVQGRDLADEVDGGVEGAPVQPRFAILEIFWILEEAYIPPDVVFSIGRVGALITGDSVFGEG